MIGEIWNYLLASLVRYSFAIPLAEFARIGRGLTAPKPNHRTGLVVRRHIPAQRSHAAACE
jgi:hypothetical protein